MASPRNKPFVDQHYARLAAANRGMATYSLECKVWSLLVSTREHTLLQASVGVTQRTNRAAVGPGIFDDLPLDRRDVGALIFDGHMAEIMGGSDVGAVVDAINVELGDRGWNYNVVEKPNYGLQDQPVASAVRGRAALQEAIATYPAVRDAVAAATRLVASATTTVAAAPAPTPSPAASQAAAARGAQAAAWYAVEPPALIDTTPSEGVRKGPPETGDFNEKEFEQFVRSALGGCSKSQREAVQEIVQAMSEQQLRRWESARKQMEQRHATVRGRAQEAKASLLAQRQQLDETAALARSVRRDREAAEIARLTTLHRDAQAKFHVANVLLQRADHRMIKGEGAQADVQAAWSDKTNARDARDEATNQLKKAQQLSKAAGAADVKDMANLQLERGA